MACPIRFPVSEPCRVTGTATAISRVEERLQICNDRLCNLAARAPSSRCFFSASLPTSQRSHGRGPTDELRRSMLSATRRVTRVPSSWSALYASGVAACREVIPILQMGKQAKGLHAPPSHPHSGQGQQTGGSRRGFNVPVKSLTSHILRSEIQLTTPNLTEVFASSVTQPTLPSDRGYICSGLQRVAERCFAVIPFEAQHPVPPTSVLAGKVTPPLPYVGHPLCNVLIFFF